MKVLITGINGCIGANYAARLRACSDASIFGIDIQAQASAPCRDGYLQLDLGSAAAASALQALAHE